MTLKLLATGVTAAAIAGACVAGVTALTSASAAPVGSPAIQLANTSAPLAPLPADPATGVPSPDQLSGVLISLADPGVPFASKSYLVEGGLGRIEARAADALMRKAVANGQVPMSFTVADVAPAGVGAATANVTAVGPGLPPATQSLLFVDQGGWKLSRSSASTVLSIFSA